MGSSPSSIRAKQPVKFVREWLVFAMVLAGFCVYFPPTAGAQAPKALSEEEVLGLLTNDVSSARVGELARKFGISFEVTGEAEQKLRKAGATDDLIKTLRELGPKPKPEPQAAAPEAPSGPAVLVIDTSPGDAQVYLDDEPMGTTSPEGRLKLVKLAPGQHVLRVGLAGFRDYEEKIELEAGTTQTLNVHLAASTPPQTSSSAATTPGAGQAGPLNGFYSGKVENLTTNVSANATGAFRENNGALDGCLQIMRPLFGSGRISGTEMSGQANFQIVSPLFKINGNGNLSGDEFSGTYTTEAGQQGRFDLHRNAASTQPSEAQVQNCPTETQQDVLNYAAAASARVVSTFYVAHDHGGMATYCVGIMTIGNGYIRYRSTTGIHSFALPLSDIKDVRRNGVYLAAIGGFHILPKNGRPINFVVINGLGQYLSPNSLILAANGAMGTR